MADDSVDSSELFASPSERAASRAPQPQQYDQSKTPTNQGSSRFDAEDAQEAREAALQKELEGVRNVNEVIEGVIGTLERAKGNMGVCIPFPIPYLTPFYGCLSVSLQILLLMTCHRLYLRRSTMPPPCSILGHAFYHRLSTTSDCFLTLAGRERRRTSLIWRVRRCRSSKRLSERRPRRSAGERRPEGKLRKRRGSDQWRPLPGGRPRGA